MIVTNTAESIAYRDMACWGLILLHLLHGSAKYGIDRDDVIKCKTLSALLAICAGNSLTTGEFPALRPVTRSFNVFIDLRLNKRLSKQSWGWWFETPSRPFCCKYHFIKNRHLCYFNSNQFLWQLSASHQWPDVFSYGLVNDMTSVTNTFPVKIDSYQLIKVYNFEKKLDILPLW